MEVKENYSFSDNSKSETETYQNTFNFNSKNSPAVNVFIVRLMSERISFYKILILIIISDNKPKTENYKHHKTY